MPFSAEKTTSSPIRISPVSGISKPTMQRSSVVLPQPLGPRRVKIRFDGITRSTSTSASIRLPSE